MDASLHSKLQRGAVPSNGFRRAQHFPQQLQAQKPPAKRQAVDAEKERTGHRVEQRYRDARVSFLWRLPSRPWIILEGVCLQACEQLTPGAVASNAPAPEHGVHRGGLFHGLARTCGPLALLSRSNGRNAMEDVEQMKAEKSTEAQSSLIHKLRRRHCICEQFRIALICPSCYKASSYYGSATCCEGTCFFQQPLLIVFQE